jgi:hypothetical protein
MAHPAAGITLGAGSTIQADGGGSSGAGTGGSGGSAILLTVAQSISISGVIEALGGGAAGGSGIGGTGGRVIALTDNANQPPIVPLGNVTLEVGAAIYISGGPGFFGGSAVSNGQPFSVSSPPPVPYPPPQLPPLGVLFMAEATPGKVNAGSVVNNGAIGAVGGANGGSGGDILFLGLGLGGTGPPVSGQVNLAGDGTGSAGDFVGQD